MSHFSNLNMMDGFMLTMTVAVSLLLELEL